MSNRYMIKIISVVFLIAILVNGMLQIAESRMPEDTKRETQTANTQNAKEGMEKEIRIGICMASAEANYQEGLTKIMMEAAEKDSDYNAEFCFANWNVKEQEKQIREFIEKKVDAIILCPVNAKSFLNVLKETKRAGIPVINLNMKLDTVSSAYITTYVGGSMSEEADLAAKLVAEYFGEEKGKVGIIEGAPGSDPQIYRTQTFLESMTSHPNIEIIGIVDGKWSRSRAKLAALDLLKKERDMEVIYCHDCNMALGAYEALQQSGKEKDVKLVGIGDALEYADALREGKLYGIISQSLEYEAEYALICAKKAARGSILRPWYKNPSEILTKENIDKYQSPMESTKIYLE